MYGKQETQRGKECDDIYYHRYFNTKKLEEENKGLREEGLKALELVKELKEELEVTSVTLDMVKDENEVNKKNLRLCFNTDDKDKADALAGRTPGLTDPKGALERVRMEKHVLRQTACHELYNLQESIHNIINSLP